MKTKFVRFNKLPRLDGIQQIDLDNKDSRIQSKESLTTSSPFKKSQGQRYNQLLEIFDGLMKKSIKQVRDFELEARDRSVIIDLPELEDGEQLQDDVLKQWITDVCSNVFSSAFHSLSKDNMTYEHTKVFCSQGILKNILLLTRKYPLSQRQMKLINLHIQQRIVPYMQKKYPLTESNDVNKAIDEKVKPIDNRQALQNDLLQKCDVVFTYQEDGNYNQKIMRFLNWLMTEIDQNANSHYKKTVYETFYEFVSKIFENVTSETWMNQRSIQSTKNISEDQKRQLRKTDNQYTPNDGANKEKYAATVREYTHYAIGRKISKNVPIYSEEEIQSGHLVIKSPAILRILTKWCEELWGKFKTKNYFLDREENIRVQQKGGNVNTMFMWMKLPLNDLIEAEKVQIQAFMKELQMNNFDQQSKLLLRELQKDGFTHIQRFEKACGKFAYKTVNNLHCYIILYLNRVIHGLLKVSKQLYDTKLSTKARWTSPPDLLSFKIGDLMRCKCSSKEREVLKIFEYLDEISLSQPKIMKIIRVKNRLKLGTNDILINVIYMEKYLCEIQLAVKSVTSKFIQCSNMFSHYVYELGRTLFGPLTELCSVWTSLDPRAVEYLNLIKNQPRTLSAEPTGCKKLGLQHNYTELDRPFVCSDCSRAYSHTNYLWKHQKCLNPECGHMICGLCRIQNQNPEKLKEMLLGQSKELQQVCTEVVNRKAESQKFLPTYGVCIQLESKKIKIQRFKKLQIKRIMTIYGLTLDKKTQAEKVTKIDDLVKRDAEKRFLRKYLVFQIPEKYGDKLIDITVDKAKKQFILPQKMKDIYKKEQEILSLIDQNIDDKSIEIMKGSKEGMEHIMNMEMADNKLTNIKFITENFPNLDRLQLSRNLLTSVETISKLKSLKKLNLRNNKLTVLPDEICTLPSLQGLNIRQNQLECLPTNFGNLKNLKKLESDGNQFTDLPESFKNLTKLTFLDLSKNKLTKFPQAIQKFTKLKELALAENKLGEVPEWIGNLKDLITLALAQTGLKNFPKSIFQLKKLQVLKIQSFYSTISQEIGGLVKMKQLHLKMPNLHHLPKEMLNMSNSLLALQLEQYKITELPDWLSELNKLQTFSLINNGIIALSNQITEMVHLKYLRIQGQQISQLPKGIELLAQLRTISLDRNKFRVVPAELKTFSKLYSLSIKGNEIESIPQDYFDALPGLETLDIDENKLKKLPSSIANLKRLRMFGHQKNPLEHKPQWLEVLRALIEATLKMDDFYFKKTVSGGGGFGVDNKTTDSKIT